MINLDTELQQHVFDILFLLFGLGVGNVAHMNDNIGLKHFFQSRPESRNQFMRQVRDKADGIGQNHGAPRRQAQLAHGGIEGGE